MSGRMSEVSKAKSDPVLLSPALTSSRMSACPWRRRVRAKHRKEAGVGHPDSAVALDGFGDDRGDRA